MRHGKTIFNEKNITQGWCDSLLLEESIKKAKEINIEGLTAVYSSPTLRAKQTAYHVSNGMKINEDFRFTKIHLNFAFCILHFAFQNSLLY